MSAARRRTAIRAGWVVAFDGCGHRLLRDGVVVVEGDRVLHGGPRFEGIVGPGGRRIERERCVYR